MKKANSGFSAIIIIIVLLLLIVAVSGASYYLLQITGTPSQDTTSSSLMEPEAISESDDIGVIEDELNETQIGIPEDDFEDLNSEASSL